MLPTDSAWHVGGGDSRVDPSGQYARPTRVFVGRAPELATLTAALAAARAGDPQVVMVQGEGGIGKSSLILEFLSGQRGLPAIAASGETAEAVLPCGVVQQLAAGATAASPGALTCLELLSQGPDPGADPLAVGMELRSLISTLQGEQAASVIVEDLQWADLPSARALLFACRRLVTDRVLMILTGRPEAMSRLGEGWARFVDGDRRSFQLTLSGLDAIELSMLCRRLGRPELSERTVGQLADHTGGNPLLARALLDELTDEELRATGRPFRAPRSLAGLILPQVAALPRAARDLVVATSVLGERAALAAIRRPWQRIPHAGRRGRGRASLPAGALVDGQDQVAGAAGGADHLGCAHQPGDLNNLAADRARRTRDEQSLSRLQPGNPGQSRIRREPGRAQHAQGGGKGRGIGVDHGDVSGVEQRVLPPAPHVLHMRAHRDLGALRGDDDADRAAVHRLVELERRHVGLDVVHPPPHVRVHRQELVPHQDLPRLRRQNPVLPQDEITRRGPPVRAGHQMPLPA